MKYSNHLEFAEFHFTFDIWGQGWAIKLLWDPLPWNE